MNYSLMIGMGCDRGTPLETLNTALDQALNQIQFKRCAIAGIATIDKKSDEPALCTLAQDNDWPLHFFAAEALAQVEVPNPSATVMKYMGTPAVAEAAALLAANAGIDDLLVEKHKYRGADGKNATVSIVKMKNE